MLEQITDAIKKNKKYIIAILLIGTIAYANSLFNEFVWDDEEMVVKNFPIFQLTNIPQLFTQATFYSGGASLSGWFYRPLVMISFLLTKMVFGKNPFGFHLVQIVFHLTNGVLLFFIFRKLFKPLSLKVTNLLSLFLALIFTTHPANIEAVSYIASVAEPLYSMILLVLFVLILYSESINFSGKKSLLISFLFFLALLTKEGAIVFLPISLIYLYLFNKKHINFWMGYMSLGFFVYLFVRLSFFGLQTKVPNFINPIGQAHFFERVKTLPAILFSFISTFIFPKDLSVSQHNVVRSIDANNFWIPLIVVAVLATISLVFLIKKRSKIGMFFFLWFVISIIPVINLFFPLDMTFAERWLYFSMIGLIGFIGVGLSSFLESKHKDIWAVIFLVIITLLSTRTIFRNRNWKDGYSLYTHDISLQPDSYDLQNNVGVELYRKGEKENALEHFNKSVELEPDWTISNNNLGAAYESLDDLERAEKYYKTSVELGDYYLAYENYASILVKLNKAKEAQDFLETSALRKFPSNQRLISIYRYILYDSGVD